MKKITQHFKMSVTKRKIIGMVFENKKVNKTKNFFTKKFEDISSKSNKQDNINKIIVSSNKSENELMKEKSINNSRNLNEKLNQHNQNSTVFQQFIEQNNKHFQISSQNCGCRRTNSR
jgi:hypothetical protein